MSLFRLHDLTSAPAPSRAILGELSNPAAQLPNMIRILAESPVALAAYRQLAGLLERSTLAPLEQQVVYLSAAHANQCHYCTVPNALLGADADAEAVADAIRQERPLTDPRLQALRRFTTALTEQRGWIPETQTQSFLDAGFSRENLLEVIVGIALVTLSSYTNHVGATPVETASTPRASFGH
ncbi:MAG: carboxymuconolactone decarboxylase family protein [Sphingobacteriia bacterium]|nr:carboxymuconolactone decarboxylase family protein [Sphingobacteriia bacterium]NCC38525.1 carboxymuconolactone decarboxylase family protein [Gammaproteobacteria bacterium]